MTIGNPASADGSRARAVPSALVLATLAAVAVRVVAATVLLAGPWTDSAQDLAGWDVERFDRIAEIDGRPWRDAAVEYPPGSVAVIEALHTQRPDREDHLDGSEESVVDLHRVLVVSSLLIDLTIAALVGLLGRVAAARRYLLLGLPLVPMGLLRLDLWAAALAVGAVALVLVGPGGPWRSTASAGGPEQSTAAVDRAGDVGAGILVAAGAAVKIWPALVVVAFWAVSRRRAAAAALIAGLGLTAYWLWWADAGLDPVDQVVALRGATGWHVESLPGTVHALASWLRGVEPDPRFELNAYRIGSLDSGLVVAGRVLAVLTIMALAFRARNSARSAVGRVAAVLLGSTAALVVTAPLVSPQFLLWLTPWAALIPLPGSKPGLATGTATDHRVGGENSTATDHRVGGENSTATDHRVGGENGTPTARPGGWTARSGRRWAALALHPLVLTTSAMLLTGGVLGLYGPPGLTEPPAATGLALRNLVLMALPVSCWLWLGRPDRIPAG